MSVCVCVFTIRNPLVLNENLIFHFVVIVVEVVVVKIYLNSLDSDDLLLHSFLSFPLLRLCIEFVKSNKIFKKKVWIVLNKIDHPLQRIHVFGVIEVERENRERGLKRYKTDLHELQQYCVPFGRYRNPKNKFHRFSIIFFSRFTSVNKTAEDVVFQRRFQICIQNM